MGKHTVEHVLHFGRQFGMLFERVAVHAMSHLRKRLPPSRLRKGSLPSRRHCPKPRTSISCLTQLYASSSRQSDSSSRAFISGMLLVTVIFYTGVKQIRKHFHTKDVCKVIENTYRYHDGVDNYFVFFSKNGRKLQSNHIFNYKDMDRIPYIAPGLIEQERRLKAKLQ